LLARLDKEYGNYMTEITENLICITCPMGCTLEVTHEGSTVVSVDGNTCQRGLDYVKRELTDPRRMVATTVSVKEGLHPLVPVSTQAPFPKPLIFDLLEEIRRIEVEAPVHAAQVILPDALGTGIDVIASREMPRRPN
jgi:CxxC motif-containing protein